MVNGETRYSCPSRFVDEIPKEVMKEERLEPRLGRKISRDEVADDSVPWNQAQTRLGVSRFGDRPNAYFDKPSVGRGAEGGSSFGSRNGFGSGFGGRSAAAGSLSLIHISRLQMPIQLLTLSVPWYGFL